MIFIIIDEKTSSFNKDVKDTITHVSKLFNDEYICTHWSIDIKRIQFCIFPVLQKHYTSETSETTGWYIYNIWKELLSGNDQQNCN